MRKHRLYIGGLLGSLLFFSGLYLFNLLGYADIDIVTGVARAASSDTSAYGLLWWGSMLGLLLVGTFLVPMMYRWAHHVLMGPQAVRSILLSIVVWIVSMVTFYPAIGFGAFLGNLERPALANGTLLVLSILYGVVLGLVVGKELTLHDATHPHTVGQFVEEE